MTARKPTLHCSLIVFLVMIGTIWIMGHMNANMMPGPEMLDLHQQRG